MLFHGERPATVGCKGCRRVPGYALIFAAAPAAGTRRRRRPRMEARIRRIRIVRNRGVRFQGHVVWREEITPYTFDVTIGSSPVLFHNSLLMLCAMANSSDSKLIAYDKNEGSTRWETPMPQTGFGHSTPACIEAGGRQQLIVVASGISESDRGIQSLDPGTGKLLWWCRGAGDAASAAYGAGIVYCDSGRGGPGVAIDPTGSGDVTQTHIRWRIDQVPEGIGSPIIVGNRVYRLHRPNVLKCWRVENGEQIYAKRLDRLTSAWPARRRPRRPSVLRYGGRQLRHPIWRRFRSSGDQRFRRPQPRFTRRRRRQDIPLGTHCVYCVGVK